MSEHNQFSAERDLSHVEGDSVEGDKIEGDKIEGDKIVVSPPPTTYLNQ